MFRATRKAQSPALAAVDRFFAGSSPMATQLALVSKLLKEHNFRPGHVQLASSVDPVSLLHSPSNVVTGMSDSLNAPCLALGGLGGLPFAGKTGWQLFTHLAQARGVGDLVVVYGATVHVAEDGTVGGGAVCAVAAAHAAVAEAGGIAHMADAPFADRDDGQYAHLLLEVARAYDEVLAPHPDPAARLARLNFELVQRSLRSAVDWEALREGRLAALGGLTVHVAGVAEPYFQPLALEVFAPREGALHDLIDDLGLYDEEEDGEEGAEEDEREGGEEAKGAARKGGKGGEEEGTAQAPGKGGGPMASSERWGAHEEATSKAGRRKPEAAPRFKVRTKPPRPHEDLLFPLS